MINLSVCMIVKDEENVLARCLDSVKTIADEIIIVDTGSTDNTKEIASKFTQKIFDFKWVDDFSKARNYAFSKATKDYIMWLDADDVIEGINKQKIIALKESLNKEIDVVYLKYDIAFDEKDKPTFSYYRERIIKNCDKAVWVEPIHEVIIPFGKTLFYEASVAHRKISENPKGRNLKIFEKYKGSLSPRLKYYYARELMYNGYNLKAEKSFENFLKDKAGFIENRIDALRKLFRLRKNRGLKQPSLLLETFVYALPKAEILCDLGEYFLEEKNFELAEYWYKQALNLPKDNISLGFVESDYYDFIPLMQLCVINDKLGRKEMAVHYNEMAGKIKPNHPSYLHNLNYFRAN